ncbi:MAG: DUF1653 domain-containing protein [Candidatus Paceibacterota bacterium]|jgi:hypothetical protein
MELKKGIYKHSKSGKEYELVGTAHHSETLEELVVYRALYESSDFGKDAIWVRPAAMFTEEVLIEGKKVERFQWVREK